MVNSVSKVFIVLVAVLAVVSARPQFMFGLNNDLGGMGSMGGGISGIGRSVTKSCVNGLCTQRVCSNGLCVGGGGSGIYRGSGMYEGSGMYGGGGIYEGNELGGLGGLYGGLGRNLLSGSSFVSNPLLSTNGLNIGLTGLSDDDGQIGNVLSSGMYRTSSITCVNGVCATT